MRLVPAASLDAARLDRVRAIYEDGFAEHLRSPLADLLADRALVLTDGEPRGLAVLRGLGDTGWVFLRYFVVGDRGRGIGGQLWTHVRSAMTDAASGPCKAMSARSCTMRSFALLPIFSLMTS